MTRGPTPKPMHQGSLDSLCGIYAVINAIRWVLGGNPLGLTAGDLFALVVMQVNVVADAGAALTQGIEVPRLHRALERTLEVLREDHDCDIALDLPYADRRGIGLAEVRDDFAATLARPGVAYLVVLWGRLDHWSVVRGVTEASLLLFDSSGRRRVPIARCRMRGERRARASDLHTLDRHGIFRLRLRPKPAERTARATTTTDAETADAVLSGAVRASPRPEGG